MWGVRFSSVQYVFFDFTLERRYGRGFEDLNKVDDVWERARGG